MTDLVGARGSSGETQLEARGFTHIVSHQGEYNTSHSYWWNARDKNCLHVETYDGRYSAITDGTKSDCHKNDSGGAAVGAAVGVALLGALLSSKSHHRQDQNLDQQQTAEFDRGYRDGLYNAPYHNYGRSDGYSRGYEVGVRERDANLNHHSGRAGYQSNDHIRGPGGLEQLCLKAVARKTGARVIGVNRIDETHERPRVYVNVDGAAAPWMCIGNKDGSVREVRYSGSEGYL
jgi:hypothetical protein